MENQFLLDHQFTTYRDKNGKECVDIEFVDGEGKKSEPMKFGPDATAILTEVLRNNVSLNLHDNEERKWKAYYLD